MSAHGTAPAQSTLRIWLEPGYDHGRWGAWMLDWPGCFCWGPTREGAIARGWSQVMGFVEWLRQHGEVEPRPWPGRDIVVEEVSARVLEGGYEINATFEADRRAVDASELERTLQWLEFAHTDLLDIARRVRMAELAGAAFPIEHREVEAVQDGATDGRDPGEVIRHVAGAETWLASRLDRTLRYEGVPRDGDVEAFVATTHTWAVERLRELWQRDPALAGTDGKGETWTLAKVLRRTVYHTLDHVGELDQRLALAENRLGRVELRVDAPVDAAALIELTTLAGLGNAARRGPAFLTRALANSRRTVSACDGDQLIGFARIAGDGTLIGYVAGVVVHPHWQGMGLGTRIVARLLEGREEERFILEARNGAGSMYERLGFEKATWAMVRRKQNPPSG